MCEGGGKFGVRSSELYGEAVGAFALICGNDPLRGDLIRRFAPPVHLAVPENPIGLALILGIFDRCGNCRLSFSAAGSESLQFSRRGKHSGLSGMPAPTYRPGCIPGKSKRGSQAPFGRFNEGGSREKGWCLSRSGRKTVRACADPRDFRLLRKLRVPFFRHRRREPAIPLAQGRWIEEADCHTGVRTGSQ